ncbi:uncharacterized protein STEHIDRAFT_50891 [Stereum hirsutum FP-91666 SS1]|uniref:uncharacterized protein n=1 Tax=Stereum hirsutum (strain FP-91666) TaxID=721885 RepID=UPI000440FBD0|nr:uncharacterized protein STEHIDRAFT_50891 [Stereum hirsutum FP-91666 SS1]EIM90554.1 hypothetical protein STEHIDRAFT_50891 [Stereum hirsutum FP-91666 SS1]
MARCSHKGCQQEFDPENNPDGSCIYHPGGPVFHEGLKSWSCCNTVNKPVLEFDEFMKITVRSHSAEPVKEEAPKVPSSTTSDAKLTESSNGKETYSNTSAVPPTASAPAPAIATATAPPAPIPEVEDDLDAPVPPGTKCKHNGCDIEYVSDEENRKGDGEGAICTYHPQSPIFHEGSKGYLCCKRRVLEFDEFLKIEGCKKGRHVFVPKKSDEDEVQELVNCRIDHYQTPSAVHVSVFAKQADSSRSVVRFEQDQIHLDLFLPGSKRFTRSLVLFGPISVEASSFKFYGTKVECTLKKMDGRSWTLLEKTDQDLGNIALTFGVGGRTGTIGAKEIVR